MRFGRERRAVTETVAVMLLLAISVSMGVIIYAFSSKALESVSGNINGLVVGQGNAIAENLVVEQAAIILPGSSSASLALDGENTKQVAGSSSSIATTLSTGSTNDLVIAYVSPANTGSSSPPTVSSMSGGGLAWKHRASTASETYTQYYAPITLTNSQTSVPAIDGSGTFTFSSTNSGSVSLTTTSSNDVVVVSASAEDNVHSVIPSVSSVSATGLSFSRRAGITIGAGGYTDEEVWYAIAASPLSGVSISVTFADSSTLEDAALVAFGVSGANTASPWDPNGALPVTGSAQTTGPPSVSGVSTNSNNALLLGFVAEGNQGGRTLGSQTAGAGFSLVNTVDNEGGVNNVLGAVESEQVTSTQSGATVAFGSTIPNKGNPYWLMVADAIQGGGVPTPNPFQQQIVWNPSTYATYEASDLGNIRFCADARCTTPLFAWLESCTPSCTTSATSATAWVGLTSSIPGNGGTLTVYMVFKPNTFDFDGIYWGEAPNLSGTYGQFDNGANVFTQYGGKSWSSFTTVEGTWDTANGYLEQTATTGSYAGGPAALIEGTSYAATGSYVLDTAFQYTTQATPSVGIIAVAGLSSGDPQGYRFIGQQSNTGAGFISFLNDQTAWVVSNTYLGSTGTSYTMEVVDNAGTWSGTLYSGYGTEGASLTTLAPTAYSANNNVGSSSGYVGVSAGWSNGANVQANPATFQWFAMRALPPNGVMPSAAFGSTGNNAVTFDLEEWYAEASSQLSSVSITATFSASDTANTWIALFAINGAKTTNPFDLNPSLPATSTGASPSSTISTTNTNDALLSGCAAAGGGAIPSGFTGIYSNTYPPNQNELVGFDVVSTAQTNLAVSCGTNSYGAQVIDSLAAPKPFKGADVYVRNVGTTSSTVVSVYVVDQSTGAFVTQAPMSTAVGPGSLTDIHVVFTAVEGHTYSFSVTSSLGNTVAFNAEAS